MPSARKTFVRCCRFLLVAFAILLPTLASAQSTPRGTARVYFMRTSGVLPNYIGVPVKINDQVVGSLKDDTYIVRSVPAGSATFSAHGFETQINVRAGQTYYIGVNLPPQSHVGNQALQTLIYGGTGGAQMPSKDRSFLGRVLAGQSPLSLLDSAAGKTTIAKLKRIP